MFARCRPLLQQSAFLAKSRPVLLSRTMATANSAKQEWLVLVPDYPGVLDKRMEVRPAHLEDIKGHVKNGVFVLGGEHCALLDEPVKDGQGMKVNGSALIIVSETKEEVLSILKNDIYNKNSVWDLDKVQILPFKSAIRTGM